MVPAEASYIRDVLQDCTTDGDGISAQALSLLDVGLSVKQAFNGLATGGIGSSSLVTQPLVSWAKSDKAMSAVRAAMRRQAVATEAIRDATAAATGGPAPGPAAHNPAGGSDAEADAQVEAEAEAEAHVHAEAGVDAEPEAEDEAASDSDIDVDAPENWNHPALHPDKLRMRATIRLLLHGLSHNPLIQEYLTVLERNDNAFGACVLGAHVVQHIMDGARRRGPLADAQEQATTAGVGILMPQRDLTERATFCNGLLQTRRAVWGERANQQLHLTRSDGTRICTRPGELRVSVEAALQPHLFPGGTGFYAYDPDGMGFTDYLKYRMECGLSMFTLYTPYVLYMYAIRQQHTLAGYMRDMVLQEALCKEKAIHPEASMPQLLRNIIKHRVPSAMPNTPAYFNKNLHDLMAMVKHKGMPSFFLTLTSDEISEMRWSEMDDLEAGLNK